MKNTIYFCEYYDRGIWIGFYSNKDLERCKKMIDMPIFGDPKTRIAEYEIKGRKRNFLEVVN